MKSESPLRIFLAITGSSLLAISSSHAIDWIGGDGTWNLAGNWSNNAIPNATNADVYFIGSSNQNITLDGSFQIRTLGFTNTGLTNIRGNSSGTTARTLTTLGSGIIVNSGAGAVTIGDTPGTYGAVNIALGANQTWTNNSESLLTLTGDMTNNASYTLTIGGLGNTAISGAINIGAVNLTKTGFGTLTLSGTNGYTGATIVNGGKLVLDMHSGGSLNSASALQTGAGNPAGTFEIKGASSGSSAQTMGNLTLGNNAYLKIVLDPNNGTGTTLTLGDAWSIGGPSAVLIDYSSSNTGTRQVITANATTSQTLLDGIYQKVLVKDSSGVVGFGTRAAGSNQAITRYDDATLATTLTSAIPTSSTVNYTTLGAGASVAMTNVTRTINSLVVDTTNNAFALDTGANTLTIDTGILFRGSNNATIDGGTITTQYIHQVGTGELTINNVLSGAGTLLGKTGAGTLVLGGNNTFTGAMNISEGIVKLGAAGNGTYSPLGTAAGTSINVGGALDLNGITLSTAEALSLYGYGVANGGALTNSGADASFSGLLTISANASIVASGGDINLTNVGSTSILPGLTVGGAKNTSIAAILTGTNTATAPASLTKIDAGTLTLTGANTYRGGTLVTGGTLVFGNTASKSTFGTHVFDAGTTLGLGVGAVSGDFGSADITAAFGTGTILTNVTVTATTNVGIDTTAGNFTHAADITGSPTKGLTKLGTGTLELSGTNTYTGATVVSAGTLYVTGSLSNSAVTVGADGAFRSTGTLGNGLTIAAGGSLDLTGATIDLNSANGGILSLTGGDLTLGNLTFQDIVGWDWLNAAPGTYELIDGAFTVNFGSTAFVSPGTAYDFGNGKEGYFTSGSLNAVIVAVPEPRAALLGGLGLLALLRRRR